MRNKNIKILEKMPERRKKKNSSKIKASKKEEMIFAVCCK